MLARFSSSLVKTQPHYVSDERVLTPFAASSCCGHVSHLTSQAIVSEHSISSPFLLTRVACIFGVGVLIQALVLGIVPMAGWLIATDKAIATYPFAALLFGGVVGGYLAPRFSHTSHSIGLGFASGLVGFLGVSLFAHALISREFVLLTTSSVLLGAANAMIFSMRHAAAQHAMRDKRLGALGAVIGVGALAGLVGGPLAGMAEKWFEPYLLLGTAGVVGVLYLVLMAFTLLLPIHRHEAAPVVAALSSHKPREGSSSLPYGATILSTVSWFLMTAMMAYAPIGMQHCGISIGGSTTVIAWHVVAMYAPAALIAPILHRVAPAYIASLGAGIVVVAAIALLSSDHMTGFSLAMIALGVGWSLNMVATQAWIFQGKTPAPAVLSRHEALLFASAMCGALASGTWLSTGL
jgi:hypothetical protein